jgi:hypothetical protein
MAPLTKKSVIGRLISLLALNDWVTVDGDITADSILDGDIGWIHFMRGGERAKVLIVPGLEPDEMIADYSCKLAGIIEPFVDSAIESH